jgi:pimeloyl-ACP methyl ester carboxylesterase
MGGKTVMEYLTTYDVNVSKAIIADIGPKQYPLHHQSILEGLNSVDLGIVKTRKEIENQLKPYIPEFGIRAFLMKNIYRTEGGQYKWRINLPVITRDVANVGTPTGEGRVYEGEVLFLRGEKSRYVLDEDIPGIRSIFPNSSVETLPNAGHWLHAEQPEAFVSVVRGYFG